MPPNELYWILQYLHIFLPNIDFTHIHFIACLQNVEKIRKKYIWSFYTNKFF